MKDTFWQWIQDIFYVPPSKPNSLIQERLVWAIYQETASTKEIRQALDEFRSELKAEIMEELKKEIGYDLPAPPKQKPHESLP